MNKNIGLIYLIAFGTVISGYDYAAYYMIIRDIWLGLNGYYDFGKEYDEDSFRSFAFYELIYRLNNIR